MPSDVLLDLVVEPGGAVRGVLIQVPDVDEPISVHDVPHNVGARGHKESTR
jgi:hypothetical protein